MHVSLKIAEMNIDAVKHTRAIQSDNVWTYAATRWHALIAPYVPMDQGILNSTVSISPGEIWYRVIYAHYQYEGERFNFRRDKHPLASAHWDVAAAPTQAPLLVSDLQAAIDSGRFDL